MASPEKTRRYLALAGDKASRAAAWERAAEYYREAFELTPVEEAGERAQLLRHLGEARSGFGDWEGAVASWREAMDAFERLGDREAVGWIGFFLRKLYGFRGQFDEASAVVQRSLDVLGDDDTEIRSRLLAQGGFVLSAFGEPMASACCPVVEIADDSTTRRQGPCLHHACIVRLLPPLRRRLVNKRSTGRAGGDLATASQVSSSGDTYCSCWGAEAEQSMMRRSVWRRAGSSRPLRHRGYQRKHVWWRPRRAEALNGQLLDLIRRNIPARQGH
jgi:tetratricopeptide (TPR) repeat protein